MQRIAAITLIIGTAVAWYGESRPIIGEIYGGAVDPQQIIDSDPSAWAAAMLFMVLGTIIAAIGLLLLALQVQRLSVNKNIKRASYLAAALAMVSALLYAVLRYFTVVLPWGTSGPGELAMAIAYTVLWQIALIISGYVLLRSGYPKWLGWPVIIVAGLILVASVIAGGLPPGINFFIVMFMGIVLLFVRQPQQSPATTQLEGASAS